MQFSIYKTSIYTICNVTASFFNLSVWMFCSFTATASESGNDLMPKGVLVRQALLWMSSRARAFILAPVSAPKRLKKRRCKSFKVRVWCNFAEDRRSGERFHARDCPHYINWYPASARTSSPVTIVWILKEEIPKSVQLVQKESRNRVDKVRLIIRLQAICSVFFDACVIMRACVHVGTSSVVQWTCNCVIQQGPPHQEVGYTSPPLSETWQGGGWKKLSLWEKRKQKS